MQTLKLAWRVIRHQHGGMEVDSLIGLVILILVAAAAIPVAMTTIVGVDTSSWDAGSAALWGILGLVAVAAVIFGIYKSIKD